MPLAAVIINWNGGDRLTTCIASLEMQPRPPAEIAVVDNGSVDGSAERAAVQTSASVINAGANLGFAGGANAGAARTTSPLILFLNPDVDVERGALELLVARLDDDLNVAVVGPAVLNSDGSLQNLGLDIDRTGHPTRARSPSQPFFVSGCALLVRRSIFEELGGFDTSYFMFAEDLDFCWRTQLIGRRIEVIPKARVFHEGGASMPGGYVVDGQLKTSARRLYLRERNTLAAVVTNYGLSRAIVVSMVRIGLGVVEAAIFCARREWTAAAAYFRAFAWNLHHFPALIKKRRRVQLTRKLKDRSLVGFAPGLSKLDVVLSAGLPSIDRYDESRAGTKDQIRRGHKDDG